MKSGTIINNFYFIKLLFKICPQRVVASLIQSLIDYFSWVFYSIIFLRYIIHSLEYSHTFYEVGIFILISTVVFLVFALYTAWYKKRYQPITDQIITYKLNKILFEKATTVDISCFETPGFYDAYTSAVSEVNKRAITILDNLSGIVSSILSSLFVINAMYTLDKISVLFIIIPVISSFIFTRLASKVNFRNYESDVPFNRKKEYVSRVFFLKKFAKEIRLSKVFSVVSSKYNEGYEGIINNVEKYKNKAFIFTILGDILRYPVAFESVWLYAAYKVMVTKKLDIGDFLVLSNSIVIATNILLWLINDIVKACENGLYINKFKAFLSYKSKIDEYSKGMKIKDTVNTLEFRNVSFKYEGQEKSTLKNINMKINSNEMIALVGHNGAGKTTIVKLIMRLYDVTEGEILLNGINIQMYDVQEYRKLFGTVFQDFHLFAMSVLENVNMGEVADEAEKSRCEEALKESGIYNKFASLSGGLKTVLTKEFDDNGLILSGGESQKVVLARVYSKKNPIVILDEPSSALDPIAENELYKSFLKIYKRKKDTKIVVVISHRLSFAVLADRIFLLEGGEILEEGTHEQLMSNKDRYAEIFIKQADSYFDNSIKQEGSINDEKNIGKQFIHF